MLEQLRDRRLLAAVAIAVAGGALLAALTSRVRDWFVMTDELLYERLAISIARSGSPLPRVHGEAIGNLNQLYPLLMAPFYAATDTVSAFHAVHVANAFVMASASVPAYLIARRVLPGWWAVAAAFLTVALPWIVLASFLLTEVVAYPVFLWAIWGIVRALERGRLRDDAVALGLIALAVLARTQLIVLAAVFPVALLLDTGAGLRERAQTLWRTRRPVVLLYAGGLVLVVVLALAGKAAGLLGNYAETARGGVIQWRLFTAFAQHAAILALTMAFLPFLLGAAWLQRALRLEADERRFAAVALPAIVLVLLEAASFDLRFGGGLVKDRYAFYAVPLLVIAALAACRAGAWPRLSLVVPLVIVLVGFATTKLPAYEKLNADSPAATLNDTLLGWTHGVGWARVLLVGATVLLLVLFAQAAALLPRRALGLALAGLLLVALPAQAGYGFVRLFRVNGTSGSPLSLDQAFVFHWVDKQVGRGGDVTLIPYPSLPEDFWASVGKWWSLEFWNESASSSVTRDGGFAWTPTSFPKLGVTFDPRTGLASKSGSAFVLASRYDTRFRLAGRQQGAPDEIVLLAAEQPWRALWVSSGLYDDGWTKPGRRARIRVFADPAQDGALTRYVVFSLVGAGDVTVRSNVDTWRDHVQRSGTSHQVAVCVPAQGYADISLASPTKSLASGDFTSPETRGQQREVGVLVHGIELADETAPAKSCP
jgi:hypothetical protein